MAGKSATAGAATKGAARAKRGGGEAKDPGGRAATAGVTVMREPTLATLGFGGVHGIFKSGRLPARAGDLVDRVFGPAKDRGALVISGGNGIVGSGKAMQLGSRLLDYGVPVVTLDLPDAPDGIGGHWKGLRSSFGRERAGAIMANVVRLSYDGASLPDALGRFRPRFVLEAIPEILDLKRSHYALLRKGYPDVAIRSVTSGFPSAELGVGVLHPSFPHHVNKMWEAVEPEPSEITQLLWALGLIPVPVSDHWSFVLDVLFCGVMLAATRLHEATNLPYWKIDKHVRRLLGPNPVRAHDAIGPGASFLTWSCLHHLSERYGALFTPTRDLVRRKESGEAWYSANRPTLDWDLDDEDALAAWIQGPLFQMTSLLLHEKRAHLSHLNAIGEICAQFTKGAVAAAREAGRDVVLRRVADYQKRHPAAAKSAWHADAFTNMDSPAWRQLYVNAEHDGEVGVITLGRESLNWPMIQELDRAIDWLVAEGVGRVILSGDFHLTTQHVGADTTEFFPALADESKGLEVSRAWSKVARRLHEDFEVSVGFVGGKRCLGGMLELFVHCRYVVAEAGAQLGFPEVTLPVVPGMEGCHWPFRKAAAADHPKLLRMLLGGRSVPARDAVGWMVDVAGEMEDAIAAAWTIASAGTREGASGPALAGGALKARAVNEGKVAVKVEAAGVGVAGGGSDDRSPGVAGGDSPGREAARRAIADTVRESCAATLADALDVQSRHSAAFMVSDACRRGVVGAAWKRIAEG